MGTRCIRCLSTQIHRAMGIVIASLDLPTECRVYELSSKGALFSYLRRRFRDLYFSEYYDDVPPGTACNGIICQDVQELHIDDGTFDLITSTEVFEHVPDDARGFAEMYRVLRDNGCFVFTVPLMDDHPTLEKALLKPDGSIEHLLAPEYHSDRIRGRRTVLAFRTYGTDIALRLGAAGFSTEIRRVTSPAHRIADQSVIIARKLPRRALAPVGGNSDLLDKHTDPECGE